MLVPYAFLWRLRTIITCVRLLVRVFLPLAGWPHGRHRMAVAARAAAQRVIDRVHGLAAHRRADAAPAVGAGLADLTRRLCSSLPTSPIVARQFTCTRRISPERRRSCAYSPSRASSCTPAPAARAICAPLPGIISTQCTVVPTGMLRSGSALPVLIGASEPLSIFCADRDALGRDHVAALAVGVAQQRDVGAAVRVVFEALDLRRDPVLVAAEVDDAVVLLVPAALVAGGDVAHVVAAGALVLRLDQRRVRRALVQVGVHDLHHRAAAGRGGFGFDECHGQATPSTKLMSPSPLGSRTPS